jgi:putative membrane protein
MTDTRSPFLVSALIALAVLLAISGLHPFDRTTWILEIFPILIAVPVMAGTYRRFPLTTLLYTLVFLHAVVLIAGGTYSYARVPLGFWLADLFHSTRNSYDKIGHFFQGFVPAMVAREIFVRGGYVTGRKMLAFVSVCVVMAISAWYELIEWAAAVMLGQGADEFLGTQGYVWDTQSDMLFAFIGGMTALILLSRLHDRQMDALK